MMYPSEWFDRVLHCAVSRMLDRRARNHFNKRQRKHRRVASADFRTEMLEGRLVLSSVGSFASPPITVTPIGGGSVRPGVVVPSASGPFRPSDITTAYGINSISFSGVAGTGAGTTIAIVDAYNDPNIVSDAAAFNAHFSLPQFNTANNPTFTVLNQSGGTALPSNTNSFTSSWDAEISLDVEWAHAIAPQANIVLFEASNTATWNLYAAVATAADYPGVSVVSMSFGSSESSSEAASDSTFTTPAGHQGVTFLSSTGDANAPASYPAYSPNVVAVGGTSLTLNSDSTYSSESAWGNTGSGIGGGGGISTYENQPSYQNGKVNGLSSTKRTAPDVSMLADPNTGVLEYDTWQGGANNGSYDIAGGTSLSCPMWAGLIAIANQGRAQAGLGSLDGPTQTLPRLYQLPSSDFHDITAGSNGFNATAGYDLATGIGSPIANLLVPALAGVAATNNHLSFSVAPSGTTAGGSLNVTVDVLDSSNNLVTSDTTNVTLSLASNPGFATLNGTTTVAAVNGVATFAGLSINTSGAGYTLTASDGSYTGVTSAAFTITAAAPSQLFIAQQPTTARVGAAITPAFLVAVEDQFGNLVSTDSSSVTLTLSAGGALTGGATTVSANASGGVATFSNLTLATAGTFTLTATDGTLGSALSANLVVARATPSVSVLDVGGTYDGLAYAASSASAVDPNSGTTLASLGSLLLSYAYYAGTLTTAIQVAAATPLGSAPLAAGSYTVVATYAGSTNYNSASSSPVNFTIARRTLHVTANGLNKTYDGVLGAAVTLGDDRVVGDSLVVTYGAAVFADKNVNSGIAINVSGISISGGAAADYTLASTLASTSANITAAVLVGSVTAANKTYDGTTSASIASRALTGLLGLDDVALSGGVATFAVKDAGSALLVNVSSLNLVGSQAGDYILSNPNETASASITARSISGSFTTAAKVYDGTTSATIVSRSLSGVLNGDSVSLIGGAGAFNSKDVLTASTVIVTGLSLGGAQAGDYSLSNPTESASAAILPLAVSGSIWANNKVYDGTTAASLAASSVAGVLGSDAVGLTSSSIQFSTKDVGNAIVVTASGLTLTGPVAGDYMLENSVETSTANIAPLEILASVDVAPKTYDATPTAAITGLSLQGVVAGDAVSVIGGAAAFNSPDVWSATTITVTGLSLTGAQARDYSLANPVLSFSASIAPLGISAAVTANDKIYDATAVATIRSRSVTGVITNDDVALGGGSASFSSSLVGNNKSVTVTGLTLVGAKAADYQLLNPTQSTQASILPLQISGTVFNDVSGSGVYSSADAGLWGRIVTLQIAGKGNAGQKSVTTDANGNFVFSNLAPGAYVVKVATPAHWRSTTSLATGDPVTVQLGQSIAPLRFGETSAATVSGSLVVNASKVGLRPALGIDLSGWTVTLAAKGNGAAMFTCQTSASGTYSFNAVPAGNYQLSIIERSGYAPSLNAKSRYTLSVLAGQAITGKNFGQRLTSSAKRPAPRRAA